MVTLTPFLLFFFFLKGLCIAAEEFVGLFTPNFFSALLIDCRACMFAQDKVRGAVFFALQLLVPDLGVLIGPSAGVAFTFLL